AAAGKQNQRLRFLPFRIGEVAVAKRRAALRARLRVARRRLDSEQFRSASMTCRPRCGRLSVRQHGSVNSWAGGPMSDMRRREFITVIGGAAAWPLAARAQQPAVPVVGFLSSRAPEDSEHLVAAFRRGIAEGG